MYKIIPNTNDLYECSREGNIRRIISYVPNNKKAVGKGKKVGGNILKPKTKNNGYQEVALHLHPGKQTSRYVHRLVADTWIGPIPRGMEVNHIDGNKKNNAITNLEIVTRKQNAIHAYKNGLNKPPVYRGELVRTSKAKEADVIKIRNMYNNGKTIQELLLTFPHLTRDIVSSIVNRRTWKHI